MPTSTDLVTDLPADFEVFGQAVATSMADLLGGTTGQILAKNSNTDMDFIWTTPNPGDITGITASSPITGGGTSGDVTIGILSGTTSNLGAVQLSTSTSSTSTTLAATPSAVKAAYDPAFTNNFYAGKNKIINGDCAINQRGFSSSTSSGSYLVDRFIGGNSGGTVTYSVQQFTPGTAPVAGYEAKQFMRLVVSGQSAAGDFASVAQEIEDVRSFAGQTVTISFWAKANTGTPGISVDLVQKFGSGGSPSSNVSTAAGKNAITTSWARYSYTVAVPSISGKTIGTTDNTSSLRLRVWVSAGSTYNTETTSLGTQANTFDIWGVQVEAGSVATPFQTASGGSPQAELAMCQRYYFRTGGSAAYERLTTMGTGASSTTITATLAPPVSMRIAPNAVEFSTLTFWDGTGGLGVITALTIATAGKNMTEFTVTASGGGITTYRPYFVIANGSTNAYLALSAEL